MATFNGTLKYKQDDGSIVELNPVGVDITAQTNLNNIATQIYCIEQTTGFNASPEDVPATSMKESIEDLNTEVGFLDTKVMTLNTSVTNLKRLPALDLPIIGIFTENGTGPNGTITIAVPIPSVVRLLSAKGRYPTFSISGGTIGTVFEYKNPDGTIHNFALSSVSVSDLGLFVSITGKPSSSLTIEPGTFVWGSYKQAATATSLHVTFA